MPRYSRSKTKNSRLKRKGRTKYKHRFPKRKGFGDKLTKPEREMLELLSTLGLDYEFVGHGSFVLGGKCPDFLHKSQKKLIEVYGDYWHRNDDPQKRINFFRKYGYDCLIIWESELNGDLLEVAKRVKEF